MPIMPAIAATANMIKHSNHTSKKVGEIHSKYPLHYQEISQLKPAQKNAISRAMYSNDLRPPIQVIQHAKTVLGDFNPVKSIFSEPAKKENDNAKWIREGFNKFLNAAYLPSIPSPEEQHEQKSYPESRKLVRTPVAVDCHGTMQTRSYRNFRRLF